MWKEHCPGLKSVKPSQVPRQEGAWAPEHSVTEFSHSQEAKLAEAQQKAMLKGEAFPDVPMTLVMKPLSVTIPAGHRKHGADADRHAPE